MKAFYLLLGLNKVDPRLANKCLDSDGDSCTFLRLIFSLAGAQMRGFYGSFPVCFEKDKHIYILNAFAF